METKFTKGPWTPSTYEGGWDCVRDSNGNEICRLVENNPDNALVLAAAPELYEALERSTKLIDAFIQERGELLLPEDEIDSCQQWLNNVDALRKARGEQA